MLRSGARGEGRDGGGGRSADRFVRVAFGIGFGCIFCFPSFAQNRPLTTSDTEIVAPGTVRAQIGFDFLQDATYPLSGLSGDLSSLGVMDLRLGLGQVIEVQLQGTVHDFLAIKKQGASFVDVHLKSPDSTSDSGNYSLWTKIRILRETSRHPALGFRFGFEMPNEKQGSGLGTNTTNVFAEAIVQKHFGKLNLFADAGLGILQVPLTTFSQNDVLIYGAAFTYPVWRRLSLAGEVAGRHSTRRITPSLIGTESRSQARQGFQFLAGGFQWDVAGIAGLTHNDPHTGVSFGVSRDIPIFKIPTETK
jgi:hypothetical protein